MAGSPESYHVWLENREMVAMGNIYSGSRVGKRKKGDKEKKAEYRTQNSGDRIQKST